MKKASIRVYAQKVCTVYIFRIMIFWTALDHKGAFSAGSLLKGRLRYSEVRSGQRRN